MIDYGEDQNAIYLWLKRVIWISRPMHASIIDSSYACHAGSFKSGGQLRLPQQRQPSSSCVPGVVNQAAAVLLIGRRQAQLAQW